MSQGASEWFLVVGLDNLVSLYPDVLAAKTTASKWVRNDGVTTKVYHLDFTTNKMTLIKEYRRRMESDEEDIVEYI